MKFSNEIVIEASPKAVWEVMRDLPAWPAWTSTVTKIELLGKKTADVGTKLKIEQPKLPAAVWTVTAWNPYEGFVMVKGNLFLRITLLHEIAPTPRGSRVTLSIVFSGLLAALVAKRYGPMMAEYLSLEAEGLKKQSEAFSYHLLST